MADQTHKCSDLAVILARMADIAIETQENPTMDSVAAEIESQVPTASRRMITESMVKVENANKKKRKARTRSAGAIVKAEARTETSLIEAIEKLDQGIAEGRFESPGKRERKEYNDVINQLKRVARAKNTTAKLKQQIITLKNHLEDGTFPEVTRRVRETSEEHEQLQLERDILQHELDDLIAEQRPKGWKNWAVEPVAILRSVMSSWDISGVLRQGGKFIFAHPEKLPDFIAVSLRAYASKKGFEAVERDIQSRKNFLLYKKARLRLDKIGGRLSGRNVEFRSVLAKYIPGVKRSERAMTAGLNKMRADYFDMLLSVYGRRGETLSQVELEQIGNLVNTMTGTTKNELTRGPARVVHSMVS